jgi:hypothetical protein
VLLERRGFGGAMNTLAERTGEPALGSVCDNAEISGGFLSLAATWTTSCPGYGRQAKLTLTRFAPAHPRPPGSPAAIPSHPFPMGKIRQTQDKGRGRHRFLLSRCARRLGQQVGTLAEMLLRTNKPEACQPISRWLSPLLRATPPVIDGDKPTPAGVAASHSFLQRSQAVPATMKLHRRSACDGYRDAAELKFPEHVISRIRRAASCRLRRPGQLVVRASRKATAARRAAATGRRN